MRRLLGVTGVALAVVLGVAPAAVADARRDVAQPVEVSMDRSSLASVLGDRVTVRSTIVNTGPAPTGPLVAHLDVVSLRGDVYVDPEDWSAERSVDVGSMTPGGRVTLEWTVRNVDAGEFDVYVVVLPAGSSTAGALSVGPAVRLAVATRQPPNPDGSLGVVVAVPILIGALALGIRRRGQSRRGPRDASAGAGTATVDAARR